MTSKLFHRIDGAAAVIRRKGGLKQVDVYWREGLLYFSHNGWFYSFRDSKGTSNPDISWEHIEGPDLDESQRTYDKLGRMKQNDPRKT